MRTDLLMYTLRSVRVVNVSCWKCSLLYDFLHKRRPLKSALFEKLGHFLEKELLA